MLTEMGSGKGGHVFICALENDADLELDYMSRDAEHLVLAPIGYDDASGARYSAFTAFSPTGGGLVEHVFAIHKITGSPAGDVIETLWNGLETKALIPTPRHRSLILATFCASAALILERHKPTFVVHATHDAHLPDSALDKHWHIMGVFEDAGYEVRTPDEYNGRRLWHATLRSF